jgi:quercetin dioxygenase-like cupin family protein
MASSEAQLRREAIVVSRGVATTGDPLNIYGDMLYFKLTGKETQGKYSVVETVTAPTVGPPLHVHHREDESFYILEGDFLFEVDGRQIELHAGDFAWAPRDVPHCFQNVGSTTGRLLITIEPAGIEGFFAEIAAITGPPDPAEMASLFQRYGLELLGPPMAAR